MRALATLRIEDPERTRTVAQLLGLHLTESYSPSYAPSMVSSEPADEAKGESEDQQEPTPPPVPSTPPPSSEPVTDIELVALPDMPPPSLAWLGAQLQPTLFSLDDASIAPIESLFSPVWTTHIIKAALATDDPDGVLDAEVLTAQLARGEPVSRLPCLTERTLRRGAQILCDHSEAMLPFRQDETELVTRIRRVMGDCIEVLKFACLPWRVGTGARRRWTEWTPPSRGTPVVLVTDLGICRTPSEMEPSDPLAWVEFAEAVTASGCPLVALVPYPQHRWPKALIGKMSIVMWDRSTTAATARRAREAQR